jgi:ribosomal protein L40E
MIHKRITVIVLAAFLGMFLYPLTAHATKVCPNCGREYPDDYNFCEVCVPATRLVEEGGLLPESKIICAECGAENEPGSEYCYKCGAEISEPEFVECANCGAELPGDAEFCPFCGTKVPGDVWEIDFDEWAKGRETNIEIVGSQVYKIENGYLVLGDGNGDGEEMRAGITVDLRAYDSFEVLGMFSIPQRQGGIFTSTGSAIKIMILDKHEGCGLWACGVSELIVKEVGNLLEGSFRGGQLKGGDFIKLHERFDLEGDWESPHTFSFTITRNSGTVNIDGHKFSIPVKSADGLMLFISVYDDAILKTWDVKVEKLPD